MSHAPRTICGEPPWSKSRVLTRSPSRRVPLFHALCGCQIQHAPYEFQWRLTSHLREVLRRTGRSIRWRSPPVTGEPGSIAIARSFTSREVRSVTSRPIRIAVRHRQVPHFVTEAHEAIATLSLDLPRHQHFRARLELFTNETDIQVHLLDPVPFTDGVSRCAWTHRRHRVGAFRVSRNSFFQVNRFLASAWWKPFSASHRRNRPGPVRGVGLFSLSLPRRFRSVTAVESGVSAHRDLEFNATLADA